MSAQFDGVTYSEELDGPRLSSQLERVRRLLSDGRWRSIAAVARICGGSESGISARIRDLRKPKFGSLLIERKRIEGGLWFYRWNREPSQLDLWRAK
jgi:hypothetical protein